MPNNFIFLAIHFGIGKRKCIVYILFVSGFLTVLSIREFVARLVSFLPIHIQAEVDQVHRFNARSHIKERSAEARARRNDFRLTSLLAGKSFRGGTPVLVSRHILINITH